MRRRAEFLLPIFMISIMVFGLIVCFSATFGEREEYLFGRQLVWVLLSCAVFVFTAYVIKRNFWKSMSIVLIFASVVTLVAVLYLGSGEGSRRWIDLGIASFQPSELAKFSLILFLGSSILGSEKQIRPFLSWCSLCRHLCRSDLSGTRSRFDHHNCSNLVLCYSHQQEI
jgi:rod shape determining protein RodA